jgi:hypothetical protein
MSVEKQNLMHGSSSASDRKPSLPRDLSTASQASRGLGSGEDLKSAATKPSPSPSPSLSAKESQLVPADREKASGPGAGTVRARLDLENSAKNLTPPIDIPSVPAAKRESNQPQYDTPNKSDKSKGEWSPAIGLSDRAHEPADSEKRTLKMANDASPSQLQKIAEASPESGRQGKARRPKDLPDSPLGKHEMPRDKPNAQEAKQGQAEDKEEGAEDTHALHEEDVRTKETGSDINKSEHEPEDDKGKAKTSVQGDAIGEIKKQMQDELSQLSMEQALDYEEITEQHAQAKLDINNTVEKALQGGAASQTAGT